MSGIAINKQMIENCLSSTSESVRAIKKFFRDARSLTADETRLREHRLRLETISDMTEKVSANLNFYSFSYSVHLSKANLSATKLNSQKIDHINLMGERVLELQTEINDYLLLHGELMENLTDFIVYLPVLEREILEHLEEIIRRIDRLLKSAESFSHDEMGYDVEYFNASALFLDKKLIPFNNLINEFEPIVLTCNQSLNDIIEHIYDITSESSVLNANILTDSIHTRNVALGVIASYLEPETRRMTSWEQPLRASLHQINEINVRTGKYVQQFRDTISSVSLSVTSLQMFLSMTFG